MRNPDYRSSYFVARNHIWQHLSDKELAAIYLKETAENIQWIIGDHHFEDDQLVIRGWAISPDHPEQGQFLINGMPFEQAHYPMASPDIEQIFWNIPTAKNAHFHCKTTIDCERDFPGGFCCLEFMSPESGREEVRRRAWYLPHPVDALPIPEDTRRWRVIGPSDTGMYLMGGATIYKRIEEYLSREFGRTFNEFNRILDWGCGSGRVSRHFRWTDRAGLTGVDIDGDNVAWCRARLPHAQFFQIPLLPPTSLANDSFDLIFGISVLTHLSEEAQFAWLEELERIARKDAVILLSIQGLSQIGLNKPHPGILRDIEKKGFVSTGHNAQLDEVIGDRTYYGNVIQSRQYVRKHWGKYFTIVDIVSALASNQDLVVMKKAP